MRRASIFLSAICFALVLSGCGSAEPPKPAGDQRQANGQSPDRVVFAFLEAVRTCNEQKAISLLSPLARQKTAEKGATFAPPGTETASFKVGQVEIVGDGGAHVASIWTDLNEDGELHSDQVIWMVRREDEGWRIVGMATKVFPDQPPLLLNFEDPDDMKRKQQLVEEEMVRRAQGVLGVEQKAPPQTVRRPAKAAASVNPLRQN